MAVKAAEITLNMSWGNCGKVLSGIQSKIGDIVKTAGKLTGIGALVGSALGAAGAAFAIGKGVVDQIAETERYRKSLVGLQNEQKHLAAQTRVLGYVSDENRKKFIDLKIQTEELAWANRFLTETNIEFERGIRNISTIFDATRGTITDMVQETLVSFIPSMEDMESVLVDNVAPALAFCATSFTNWRDVVDVMMSSAEISLKKTAEYFVYFFHDYIPSVLTYFLQNFTKIMPEYYSNLLKFFQNIGDNVLASIQWLCDQIYAILPPGIQDAFSDVRTIFDNFIHNCTEFAGSLIAGFFSIPDRLQVFGANFVQFFKNLYAKIGEVWGKMKKTFSWQSWKDWWNSEGKTAAVERVNVKTTGLTNGFQSYEGIKFGEGANYRSLLDGIATDDEREKRRKEREENKPKFKSLMDGMDFSAWKNFKAPEITYKADTKDVEKRLMEATGNLWKGYTKNLEYTRKTMEHNIAKSKDKVNPEARPVGQWEMLKLLEGSQKSSTEGLTSAYDRINNAVANKNPVVDVLNKQREEQKKQAEEQKAVEAKKVEKQEQTASKTTESAASLDKIYNLLATWKTPMAAVVEG